MNPATYGLLFLVSALSVTSLVRSGSAVVGTLNTDEVAEGLTNLYFTDLRARSSITVQGPGLNYNQETGILTANFELGEIAVTSVNTQVGDVVLDTDNVTEGDTNKYFTEERSRNALSAGGDLQYDSTTGLISFTDAVTSVNTQVGDVVLNTDNVAEGDTNKYFTEERSRQALSVGGDLQYDSTTGLISFTDAVTSVNTQVGDVVLNTDNVAEGDTNKYFTEERSRNALSAGGDLQYDSTTGLISFTDAVTSVNTQVGDVVLNTDNVAEGDTNKYFTEERSRNALSAGGDLQYDSSTGLISFTDAVTSVNTQVGDVVLNTDNVAEGDTNKYFTEERSRNALSAGGDLQYDSSTGLISFTDAVTSVNTQVGDVVLNTDNVAEGDTNKYFTEERSRNALSAGGDLQYDSTTGLISFTDAVTSVNTQVGDVVLNTDNVAEGDTNKYFTEERSRNALSAGGDLQYDSSTGLISFTDAVTSVNTQVGDVVLNTDNVAEGDTNKYFTEERSSDRL
jgi:hypothetical protein